MIATRKDSCGSGGMQFRAIKPRNLVYIRAIGGYYFSKICKVLSESKMYSLLDSTFGSVIQLAFVCI
jgi:hypothetical protein